MDGSKKWRTVKAEGLHLEYCPGFLGRREAYTLFSELEEQVTYLTGDLAKVKVFGKWHDIPRQQIGYGDEGLSYKYSGRSLTAKPWLPCLLRLRDCLQEALGVKYNFVLVNRYRNGLDHMGEHKDDEKELDKNSGIASVSLGEERQFVLRHEALRKRNRGSGPPPPPPVRLILHNGSLLVMHHPTNSFWYHSLPTAKKIKGVRINLTFRKIV